MAVNFSADIHRILQGHQHIATSTQLCEKLGPGFEDGVARFKGCWGREGTGDEFADAIVPQTEQEEAEVLSTLQSITGGFQALVLAFADEAGNVERPQLQALEDIEAQGAESEDRR